MELNKATKLDRVLNAKDMIGLAFGAAIGWGWVVMAGGWLKQGGTLGAILGFALGGLMVTFVGMTYSELCPALPQCGGEQVFSYRALGYRWSFVCSWALVLCYLGVVAYEACAFPSVLELIIPSISQGHPIYTVAGFGIMPMHILIGVSSALFIMVVNYRGVKMASRLQSILVGMIVLSGAALIISAVFKGDARNAQPLFVNGAGGMLSVAVMTPFFLVGFDVVPQAAEEANFPVKKLGGVMLFSILLSVVWYCIVLISVALSVNEMEIESIATITAYALQKLWGGSILGKALIVCGGLAGIISSWNAFLIAGSRVILSMSISNMLPKWFGKIHPTYKTPSNAILFLGCISCIAPFFGKVMLTWIANAASLATVVAYGIVSLSFLVLRRKEPELPRPNRIKYGELVGVIAVLLCVGMMSLYLPGMPSGLNRNEWTIIGLWSMLGICIFAVDQIFKRKGRPARG